MACILKLPSKKSKGVISFTNLEYLYQIKYIRHTRKIIEKIKNNWIICYHPNWEDKKFQANNIFDAVICHKQQFNFTDKNYKIPIIDTTSNRMAPSYFKIDENKTWDFFHVSKYDPQKNIEGFFKVIKSALRLRQNLTGILLISVKPKELKKIRNLYHNYFTEKERENFELITLTYDLPFPLSKKILAHFYNASKVTLNTHLNEPGGKVVGYSLAAGLPVVGFKELTQMVSKELRKEPFFFTSDDQNELANLLIKSINYVEFEYDQKLHKKTSNIFSEIEQSVFLKNELVAKFKLDNNGWFLDNLDLRLSKHFSATKNTNEYEQSVLSLVLFLLDKKRFSLINFTGDFLNLETYLINHIQKNVFNMPFYIRLLDFFISRFMVIGYVFKIKTSLVIILKIILPKFIINIIKKYLV